MSKQFTRGQTVYDIHGRGGLYVARAANGHIVEPMHAVDDDDEPHLSEAQTWREVFASPPTEVLHAEVAEIEKKLAARRAELDDVREQRRAIDAEERARMERLKKHVHLSRVDDYIEGRVTHFVCIGRYGNGVSVKTFDEVMRGPERRNRLPLLVLYGDLYNDYEREMRVSEWCALSDGHDHKVLPCTSLEEAQEKARAELDKRFAAFVKDPKADYGHRYLVSDAESALALGVDIPAAIAAEVAARKVNAAAVDVQQRRAELERAQAAHAAAVAKLEALPKV